MNFLASASAINDALTTDVSPTGIVTEFLGFMPWIGAMVISAFAINILRKALKGASKGKLRV